jgi:hypothetical protein
MLGVKPVTVSLALIAILAILGLILVGLSQRVPSNEHQSENQYQPTSQQASTDQKVANKAEYHASAWAKIKQSIERNEKVVTALSTAFIAAFTIALVLANGFLYFSSQKVADAAKDSAGDARKKVTQRDPQGRLLSTYEEENDDDVRDALPVRDGNMTLDAIEARHAQRMADEYRRYDARVREMWRNP